MTSARLVAYPWANACHARESGVCGMSAANSLTITVNGVQHAVRAEPDTPLLYVLRNELGLNGPLFGCGLEQCGACKVLRGTEAVT